MSVELLTFVFNSIFIRILLIGDDIWFIASDIAKALGYKDFAQAVNQHCKYAKSLIDMDPLNKLVQENHELRVLDPKIKIFPESDFYRISLKTRKNEAETLIDFVSNKVIPKIRNRNHKASTILPDNIVTYDGVQFLRYEEEYEVRKGKIDTLAFYTKRDSGESGMSVKSLANGCGVALNALQVLLEEKNIDFFLEGTNKQGDSIADSLINKAKRGTTKPADFYLIKTPAIHVILDIHCERIFRYYAYESRYKKTKARELYIAYTKHGIRDSIQAKTQYDPQWALFHNKSTLETIDEKFKTKITELELKLVEKDTQLVQKDKTITELTQENKILKFKPQKESAYLKMLHAMVGGEREVYIDGPRPGRIDIVTDKMMLEVKNAKDFREAYGQLLEYCHEAKDITELADKICGLFLFGNMTETEIEHFKAIAKEKEFQLFTFQDIKDHITEADLDTLNQSL
ncbi:hypothetical protein TI05_07650 [Achromatium sp. WMS3]|nr:hypothetical protein TI05_07650 [Achromatium sp. WMS3]